MNAPHRAPLLRALKSADIAYQEVSRDASATVVNRLFRLAENPVLVLVDDSSGTGPDGWPVALSLLRWARVMLVTTGDGRPADYADAIAAAQKYRRSLVIETDAAHVETWRSAAVFAGIKRVHPVVPEVRQ